MSQQHPAPEVPAAPGFGLPGVLGNPVWEGPPLREGDTANPFHDSSSLSSFLAEEIRGIHQTSPDGWCEWLGWAVFDGWRPLLLLAQLQLSHLRINLIVVPSAQHQLCATRLHTEHLPWAPWERAQLDRVLAAALPGTRKGPACLNTFH